LVLAQDNETSIQLLLNLTLSEEKAKNKRKVEERLEVRGAEGNQIKQDVFTFLHQMKKK